MSASASKKKRKELEEQGLSAQAIAERKAKDQKAKTLKNALIIALAIVVCFAAIFTVIKLINRPSYDVKAPVVTVGEEKVSVPVYNYFYNLAVGNFYNSYSFLIQTGVPLSQQKSIFGGTGTMEDYMKEMTTSNLKEILNVVSKAKAEGYKLSDDNLKEIDSSLDTLKQEAKQYGFSSVDRYLRERYGEGCNSDNYEDYLKLYMTFSGFATKLNSDFHPSAEDMNKTYEDDKGAFDVVSFTYATVSAESSKVESIKEASADSEKTEDDANTSAETTYTPEAIAAAKEKAESYTKEMPKDATTTTLNKDYIKDRLNAEIADWLFDEARKEGDVKVFSRDEKETYFFTVRFDNRDNNDYCLVNANIIKISKDKKDDSAKKDDEKETDSEDASKQEESETAEQKRSALVASIRLGMSDEDFNKAVTALGYSASTTSYTRSDSAKEIRDFLFDENRMAGDLYLDYEDDNYYYVVRYVSTEEETYRNQLIMDKMWSTYYSGIAGANEISVDEELLKFANTDLTFNSSNNSAG